MTLRLIEESKERLDNRRFAAAVSMGLSKALDSIPDYLLMVKLNAYSFDRKYLVFFYSYLNWRRQQVNVNNIQSTFEALRSRVP